jgi:predicted Ser/Thr protein kinase
LFQNLYPITDQVDVLISELVHKLNIYNIQESVYQYNLETDTQNNLHVIFMSPFYGYQRELISNIEKYVSFFMDTILDNNEDNSILTLNMIYDTVYHYVLTDDTLSQYSSEYLENYNMDYSEYQNYKEYDLLLEAILYFINSAKKGTQVKEISKGLLRNILYTINNFKKYHNKMNDRFNKRYKAYDYGSTSNVYKLEDSNIIVKQYNSKLRCTIEDHDNPQDIFDKELNILKITQGLTCSPKLIDADRENLRIYIEYAGESLYRNFTLPNNWEDQINNIFDQLDHNKINYSEFWLQNILVLDNKITLVDYGLAKFNSDTNNNNNRKFFIDNLKALNPKLSVEPDRNTRLRLIRTFFDNLKNQ